MRTCNPKGFKYIADINQYKEGWELVVDFSDNDYIMVKYSEDITELGQIRSILDNRLIKYINKEINTLNTSDLGFKYIRK